MIFVLEFQPLVSIHAPLAGSDMAVRSSRRSLMCFNPRSPRGERPAHCSRFVTRLNVSIHAPLAGSDMYARDEVSVGLSFNPRSPRGERRPAAPSAGCPARFNPRSPRGERLAENRAISPGQVFQSTLPSRGATGCGSLDMVDLVKFQSTLPSRGATGLDGFDREMRVVSIHAPLAGSDDGVARGQAVAVVSIHAPLAGSDGVMVGAAGGLLVSIHAPLAGSDVELFGHQALLEFQSTLPSRGATRGPVRFVSLN